MIEILSQDAPYPDLEGVNVAIAVTTQQTTPEIPDSCPPDLAAALAECWSWEPAERPTFVELHQRLSPLVG
jgi:Protein tyrosine and serine/threonine kinase